MPDPNNILIFDKLELDVRAARSVYEQSYNENVTLTNENAALEAEIELMKATWTPPAEPPDPEPEPEPTYPVRLMGATINTRDGQTQLQAITQWETNCGTCAVRRVFLSGTPTETSVAGALKHDYGKRHRILSYKGKPSDAVLKTIKVDGFLTYLILNHEPENDGGTHTAAWFRDLTDAHIAQVKGLGRDDLVPAFCLMGWLDNDPSSTTTSKDWFPTTTDGVVMFLDPYDPNNRVTMGGTTNPTLKLWREAGGTRWGITETGTHRTGTDGVKWVKDAATYVTAERGEALCWFHSAVGAQGPWWLDDKTMQAAWKVLATG